MRIPAKLNPRSLGSRIMQLPPWLTRLRTVFSLDLRSIALFRILLAVIILWDLALRSQSITDFYTDEGVLPRGYWLHLTNEFHWSLHTASGHFWWQALLFFIAAVAALALLVGYRSRVMAFTSFVLLASLINRNELILHGGDQLLVIMSFWSLFLPLGARWSIDSALQMELKSNPNLQRFNPSAPQLYFSVATVAVILQVLYLYFFTALLKTGDAWTYRFDAAFYAISLEQFATPIGIWMRQFPGLLKFCTMFVIAVEYLAPLLVLLPLAWPRLRIAGLLLLASLHAGFLLMLHIGLFPFIDWMSLSLLIPSACWIWLHQRRERSKRYQEINKITIYYDEDCGFCLKMCLVLREMLLVPTVPIRTAQSNPSIHAIMMEHNSWVIEGPDKATYIHWHAMGFLFSQRWPFKPIGWLMRFKPLMHIGNALYRWVANNRGTMGRVTAWMLPWRNLSLRPTLLGSLIAAFFFVAVTVYNVSGIPGNNHLRPTFIESAVRIARLDQHWNMFAPYPLTQSIYPQVPGKTRGGESVNLFPTTEPSAEWIPPEYLAPIYNGYRWRKYMGRVSGHKNNMVRQGYGNYQCQQYNHLSRMPALSADQLATFEVWFVKRRTNTTGDPKEVKRHRVWRHWCFGEFKPKQ